MLLNKRSSRLNPGPQPLPHFTRAVYQLQQQLLIDQQKKYKSGSSSTYFVFADQRRAAANYDRELGRTLEHYHLTIPKE